MTGLDFLAIGCLIGGILLWVIARKFDTRRS